MHISAESDYSALNNQVNDLTAVLGNAITWSERHLKHDAKALNVRKLKNLRRKLKKIGVAIEQNPSTALYGESQVGKSYLVENLLSLSGRPLTILNPSTGTEHEYLKDINPYGEGTEATSIVTRFSTTKNWTNKDFPITVKLLSPKDIVLLLCDTYFSDVIREDSTRSEVIESHCVNTLSLFGEQPVVQHNFTEDDVYDIKDYLEKYAKSEVVDLLSSNFFEIVSGLIGRAKPEQWYKLFEVIWNKNQHINETFNILIKELSKLQFADTIFAEFNAVLNKNGTMLGVARLRELNREPLYEDVPKERFIPTVNILLSHGGENTKVSINKSVLCALSAELIFQVDKNLEAQKPFLRDSDLLDFPGARARLENMENRVNKEHISQMVLRGKISYIFNKYSSQYLISNLFIVNRSTDINANYIPRLLNDWITSYIGKTSGEREDFMKHFPVPPLFFVYTFFNNDLTFNPTKDTKETLSDKWTKRFVTIFENQFVTQNYKWHKEWTLSHPYFNNSYMLRDFEYSRTIFDGLLEKGEETRLIVPDKYQEYYSDLRNSFIGHEYSRRHFLNPEQTWEESATLNKDGSELIIRNLSKISNNKVRVEKFKSEINKIYCDLSAELEKHYHSNQSDMRIKTALKKAGTIHANIDTVFGDDQYLFGKFIDLLLVKESDVFIFYRDKLRKLELVENSNLKGLLLIRRSNPDLSSDKSYTDNMAILMETYSHCNSLEELETYFIERGIDLNELFYGQSKLLKSNSEAMAEGLKNLWFDNYLKTDRVAQQIGSGFAPVAIEYLFECLRDGFVQHEIESQIAKNLRKFVDRFDQVEEASQMMADISSTLINNYVVTLGKDYYAVSKREQILEASKAYGLRLEFPPDVSPTEYVEEDELAVLYEKICGDEESEILEHSPVVRNIENWRNLIRIAFVAHCDIPNYDVPANDALRVILDTIKNNSNNQ